jgi:hypothetical protein
MSIKLSSTLTENDIELDVGLIEWEDDKLNKIVDRCILIASSLMEGGGESPYPYQIEPMKRIFRSVLTNDGACITGLFSRQSGKCLGKGTRVIRYDGSVDVVENIKEGDLLMGDDSTPRKVSGLCKGIDDLYRIVPKSPRANPYVVNSEHIMSVIHNKYKGKHKLDISIKELLKDKYKSDIKQSRILGYQVPVTFPELNVALPIDPYILGIWLGGGTSSKSAITTMDEVIVDAWRKEAEKRGLNLRENVGTNKNGELSKATTYNMSRVIVKKDTVNTFTEDLRKLNVMDNKHIPDIYKFGSEENRMAILSGIIDTVGHKPKCPSKKYVCELTLKEGKLADDIIFLVRSLGFRVAVTTKVVRCKNYTSCFIYGELWKLPLRVPHKIYEYITPLREEPLQYGFDIEYIGKGEYYGFILDANHRFLLEDFTVTHNTSLTAAVIGTLMIVSPLLSQQFPDKFPYFKKGIMIGVFAPTTDQVSTTHARVEKMLSHDTTNAILNDPDIRAAKKYDKGVIRILGNPKKIKGVIESDWTSLVRFQTADKRAKIESKSYQVIFIDECQEVDDTKILKSIRPMMAAYNGTSVYTGTPSPYVCEFYNAIMRNRAQDISKPAYLQNHFEYDYNITGKYNKRYKKYVEGEKENLGEDSDAFQMSYALKWLVEKGMALSPSDFQRYMADVRSDIEKSPVDGFQYVAGLDLGKGIDDPSVLTIARLEKNVNTGDVKKRIVFWKEFTNPSWEAQFTEILIMLRAFNVCAVSVDSTGKGDPIAERLKAAMVDDPINVYAIPFSTQSKHTLATDFYEEMYKNRISIPCGVKTKNTKEFKKFYGEWLTAVKTYTGKFLQLEHPRDLTGAHDDYVDSLLLLIQAAKKVHAHVVRQEYVDWRTTGSKLLPSEMYRSSQEYAKVRVNELFNKNK